MRKLCLIVSVAGAMALAGCGGDDDANKGGTLTVMAENDLQYVDPGAQYYQFDYMITGMPGQRALYGWKPEDRTPRPDLASSMPQVTDGGKTVTIKLRKGVKFSPPVNREVTSADVKYAMERIFKASVGNGYASAYFSAIEGNEEYSEGKTDEIEGIQAPDPQTLVLKLTNPVGVIANGNALSLPGTAPVPKEYAEKFDKGETSTYGQHVVFTGPYMVPNDKSGKLTGHKPGKSLTLVRNPNWDKSTDFREANLDRVQVSFNNAQPTVSRKILSGRSMVSGDFAAPEVSVLKQALQSRKEQLDIVPSGGNRYIGVNTQVEPTNDLNFRKAVAAVTDRDELRLTRGGETLGTVATHFVPPDIPGFEEAGGEAGPGFDFYENPNGDVALAKEYLKKAGYESGMYDGPPLLMVGDDEPPASKTGEAFQAQLEKIGIELTYRQVPHDTMLSNFCEVPKQKVVFCPNMGWAKDFYDAQSFIGPIFNGKNIVPTGNVNVGQLNVPELNKRMDAAEALTDQEERSKEWGDLDRAVTEQVAVITWLWDNQVNIKSTNVDAVVNDFNSTYDLSFTSLK